MRTRRDDAIADGSRPGGRSSGTRSPVLRTVGLAAGFLLAVAATGVVFLTDDPRVLRLAVVGAAWAFVLAALSATRRAAPPGDGDADAHAVERAVAEREAELRLAHDLELERVAAGRREDGLRREADLRREAEEPMRTELAALRGELAQVAGLRREVAEVARLRGDLAQLAELRADVGRLRAELTEQLSGETLIERIVLRTQSDRPGPPTAGSPVPRTIEAPGWDGPAQGPAGSRPAVGLDEPTADPADPEPRRRRSDAPSGPAVPPAAELTVERPVAQRDRPPVPGPHEHASPEGPSRPAGILAESGTGPLPGGGRRRRHRDGDGSDDVLSRVLGR